MEDRRTTRLTRHVRAPRSEVYRALVDRQSVARWKVPAGMTCTVHTFDPREGGSLRISLTYDAPGPAGKTTAHTDTYSGRFLRLVPGELVVEADEFETDDPAYRGEMTITIALTDAEAGTGVGTEVIAVHEGLPPGVDATANELGWREALDRLAALVEADA